MTTVQAPIGSGFGPTSTTGDVIAGVDLSDRVAIVTGGASGTGVPTTRALAGAGATVVVPARDVARAREALAGIDRIEIAAMDLVDPASIDAFAAGFIASGRPLHLLVNSAGIGGAPLERDARGFESHFATNHLGHFQLVARLWPALVQAQGARVVTVSSWAHRAADVSLDDPNFEHRDYDPQLAYGQSKTANVLFALALDRRGEAEGVRSFSLHPGTIVDSNFKRYTPPEILQAMGMMDDEGRGVLDPDKRWKSADQGAATSVWCVASSQLDGLGGVYAQDCDVAALLDDADEEMLAASRQFGSPPLGVMAYAVDADTATRLWTQSEQLTGVAFP